MEQTNTTPALASIQIERCYVSETDSQNARRKRFDKAALEELTESVRTYGILQPIIVRERQAPGGFLHELVAGERRFLAAQAAGLEEIPAVVRDLTDEQVIEVQLIENLQRVDVHPMEEAEGYQQLMKVHGHPIEELHARVGKSRSYVYGRLKLLALSKKARDTFYAGEISASIALLIARIPSEKLQAEALARISGGKYDSPMSYREAKEHVHQEYMLRLADAPFPTDDAKLNGKAGPCGSCPKRTGNQPELFGDVKSADVCTDPVCYRDKANAYGQRLLATAKQEGRKTITGAAAKKVAPYGVDRMSLHGYHTVRGDSEYWAGNGYRKVSAIVGKDYVPELLQCPETGKVVEVVPDSVLAAAVRKSSGGKSARTSSPENAARKKAVLENKYRKALYAAIRPELEAPTMLAIAKEMFERIHHEDRVVLCDVRGFEPPTDKRYGGGSKYKDYSALGKTIAADNAESFINDMLYVGDLHASGWSKEKPEKLLAAAQLHGINAAAIRRELEPKKAAKKKKAAKTKKSAAGGQ